MQKQLKVNFIRVYRDVIELLTTTAISHLSLNLSDNFNAFLDIHYFLTNQIRSTKTGAETKVWIYNLSQGIT